MTRKFALYLLQTTVLVSAACSASFPTQPTTPAATVAIAVRYPSKGTQLLARWTHADFEAYAIDADGVYVDITDAAVWRSSNESVLGGLTGRPSFTETFFPYAAGTAEISATYQNFSDSLIVTVQEPSPPYLRVLAAPSMLVHFVSGANNPQDVTRSVTWTSSNPQLGVVTDGRFMPLSPGNLELRATYNGVTSSYWISAQPRRR